MAKTLLLTAFLPGTSNVAEILVGDMLDLADGQEIQMAAILPSPSVSPDLRHPVGEIRFFSPPVEYARVAGSGFLGTARRFLERRRRYTPAMDKISAELASYIRDSGVDRIWSILSTTAAIDMTHTVAKKTRMPILAHVWDDPRHIAQQRHLDRLHAKQTWHRFTEVLARASRIAVICDEMANAYQPYSSAEMLVIRHGLKDGVRPSYPLTTSTEFHIAFIGSMYCYSAWKAFLSALDILNWRIGKKDVVLNVVGSEINLRAFRPARAVFHGWRELPYIETLLAQCDLLYLPQPFEDWQRILAELSFPTKLSTYVTTGKPVLVHAPSYSSVSLFAKRHEMESVTAELNPEKLAALLTLQFTNPSQVERYCEQSARIGSTSLGKQQFVDATRAFLR